MLDYLEYRLIGGERIPIHTSTSLARLELRALIAHAQLIKSCVGIQRVMGIIPDTRAELASWILRHQSFLDASSPGMTSTSPSTMVGLANLEGAYNGYSRPQTTKFVLAEEHSRHAQQLIARNPLMAAAILREINDGVQKFHDGIYGGDLLISQKKLGEDIYKELHRDKDGSFFPYRTKFLNFSVVVGNIGFSGDIPCFRYKIMYPAKWTHIFESAWVSVFFTLKETELKMLFGDSDPYAVRDMSYGSEIHRAENSLYHAEKRLIKEEERIIERDILFDASMYARHHTRKFILEESHSKHAIALAKKHPAIADAILEEIDAGIQKFHDGIFGGDLFMAEKRLAEDIDKELHRDKHGSLLLFRDKFLNFSVLVGNMAYDGDIPCFRYKVMYPKKWTHQFGGGVYETAFVSVFYTLKDDQLNRLVMGYSA